MSIAEESLRDQAAECEYAAELERVKYWKALNTPFMMLKPNLYKDGDQWCALFGSDIQEGVCGFGCTPELAAEAFNNAWTTNA